MYEHETKDTQLLKTMSSFSIANLAIGAAELTAGTLTHRATLTMAGMHVMSDGGLYFLKRRVAGESDPAKKRRLQQVHNAAPRFY